MPRSLGSSTARGAGEDGAGDREDLRALDEPRLEVALVAARGGATSTRMLDGPGHDRSGDVPGEGPEPPAGVADLGLHRPGEEPEDEPTERAAALLPAVRHHRLEGAGCRWRAPPVACFEASGPGIACLSR